MPRVKFFVNDIKRQLLKSEITREGNRAIDQANMEVPPETPVCATDKIIYVQDMVDICTNRLLFNFCQHIKDESGYEHQPIGSNDFPTPQSHWDFQCVTTDEGILNNTATENPLDMCMCCAPTPSQYVCGKVRCVGTADRAINFTCMRYLTISCETDYDFRQDQRWSLSTWVFPTTGCLTEFVMGKRVGLAAANAGYSLEHNKTCNNSTFTIGNGTTEFTVASTMCTVPACMWTNITVTYNAACNQDKMKIYINGELNATGATLAITGTVTNNAFFSIGASACTTDHFIGRVDGTYVFNSKLSDCSVKALFFEGAIQYVCGLWDGSAIEFDGCKGHVTLQDKAPACPRPRDIKLQMKFECNLTDSTGKNCPVMGNGVETYTTSIIDDKAFCFEGGACGRYVSVPNNPCLSFNSTGKFSFALWAKINMCIGASTIIGKKSASGTEAGWRLRTTCVACTPNIGFEIANGTTIFALECSTPPSIFDCKWHHFAGTYAGAPNSVKPIKLYIDGLDKNIVNPVTVVSGCFSNTQPLTIGAAGDGTLDFTGDVVCARVWKGRELTKKEIKNLHDWTI